MLFTIFTPSYNRAKLLGRVYSSLLVQSCKDFEWIVVDDGSHDETQSVMRKYIMEDKVPIKYIQQNNHGKHSAHNEALKHSSGKWFICVDSDDVLSVNALYDISLQLHKTTKEDCGLVGYKVDFHNKLLCSTFPKGVQHINAYELDHTFGLTGEFAYVFKTEIISKYLFPVIEDEKFITENVLYDALAIDNFKLVLCPIIITECEYQKDGLTSNQYRVLKNNPIGYMLYYKQRISLARSLKTAIGYAVRYHAFRCLGKVKKDRYQGKYKVLVDACELPGKAVVYYYKYKFKKMNL